jgi:hypothetical protein
VNLTPFAGLLSNGQPHTVSLSVYNADSDFSATASLLLYLDPDTAQITGAVTRNSLTGPSPVVTEKLNVQPTFIRGKVGVSSNRSFVISGYTNTSRGKVTTTVEQTINFSNNQFFDLTSAAYVQNISQTSEVFSTTTTWADGAEHRITSQWFNFPLTMDISLLYLSNGNINQITKAKQNYQSSVITLRNNRPIYYSSLMNGGEHADTLELNSSYEILGNTAQSGAQHYSYFDSDSAPYYCAISAAANVLTFFSPGCAQ